MLSLPIPDVHSFDTIKPIQQLLDGQFSGPRRHTFVELLLLSLAVRISGTAFCLGNHLLNELLQGESVAESNVSAQFLAPHIPHRPDANPPSVQLGLYRPV